MIDFRNQPPGYEQGIYDISFETYQAIPALNSGKLKQLRRTPAHFKAALEGPPKEITPQLQRTFDKGKAFDIFVLDGGLEALKKLVSIEPGISRQKKEYQLWKEGAVKANKLILSQTEFLGAVEMAGAAYRKKTFSHLFANGHPHRVIVWRDPATGLWCKGEIDWITADGIVVDLKSTADAGFWFFNRNSKRLGYVNQGAFYLAGLTAVTGYRHTEFRLAAVEVDPPHESQVFKPDWLRLSEADNENRERMATLLRCLETDEWPGYPDQVIDLDSGIYQDEIEINEEETEETIDGF